MTHIVQFLWLWLIQHTINDMAPFGIVMFLHWRRQQELEYWVPRWYLRMRGEL